MSQEETEVTPEGEDPGTVFTESDQGERSGQAADPELEPEGEDPGDTETFGLEEVEAENEERLDLASG